MSEPQMIVPRLSELKERRAFPDPAWLGPPRPEGELPPPATPIVEELPGFVHWQMYGGEMGMPALTPCLGSITGPATPASVKVGERMVVVRIAAASGIAFTPDAEAVNCPVCRTGIEATAAAQVEPAAQAEPAVQTEPASREKPAAKARRPGPDKPERAGARAPGG